MIEPKFLQRFDQIWAALRRFQVYQGLSATLLLAATLFGLLVVADYQLELSRNLRMTGLVVLTFGASLALWSGVIAPLRWWTKPRTAVEIESRFPQLGQRIRTVVQYAGLDDRAIVFSGVAPSLVSALNEETAAQVDPLPLDRVVPWRRVYVVVALSAVPLLLLAVAALRGPEWRTAIQRVALVERPYTTLAVIPGNAVISQGSNVPIRIEMNGRARRNVVLQTREVDDLKGTWKTTKMDHVKKGTHRRRVSTMTKVQRSLLYRVVAGPTESPLFGIRVRYPLAIRNFEVTLTPPAYTVLDPSTVPGGDFQAVQGTGASFSIAFDAAPDTAYLELIDPTAKRRDKGDPVPVPKVLPLKHIGKNFVAEMNLTDDFDYTIVANAPERAPLKKNRYRVDVRVDRAPRVVFEEPDEALEVHAIAEIRQRIRAGDDFGLTKAGIVFQFNDGEEQTLILKDFPIEKGTKPLTTAAVEETLLMEKLSASSLDSVTYYAFAEDNYPGTPRRTESDLRYIDIRPFKRDYKIIDPLGGGEPEEFTTLEELIGRQRFNLNRANRLARHRTTSSVAPQDPLMIANFEETLVNMAREFTEGIEGIVGQKIDELHSAEAAMLSAIEALDRSRNDDAPPPMSEALKHLVSARRELVILIGPDSAAARAARAFDRKQAQKIRKPKGEEEEAEALAEELEELAEDEDFVYATISAASEGPVPAKAMEGSSGEAGKPKKSDPKAGEPKASEKMASAKGQTGSGTAQGQGGQGSTGKRYDRREIADRQDDIIAAARDLEEKLKRLEAASDLTKARMSKAAEKAEGAAGALSRGNSREAATEAKAGAGMLHELARQVKGEIRREVADELAMARDLAEELAQRERDLAEMNQAEQPGEGPGDNPSKGRGSAGGFGGWDTLNDQEQLERLAEAAKTLESWLKQIDQRGEGKAADAVREMLETGTVEEVVERTERMGEVRLGGKPKDVSDTATELASKLEMLGESLDLLHRGIVAPQHAAMVELDRRVAALTAKLNTLKIDADITAWHREAAALIRDLEKAGVDGAMELADAIRTAGRNGGEDWDRANDTDHRHAPGGYASAISKITTTLKDQIQEMILKDLVSARDETAPPMYREMIERYYEVLSKDAVTK